MIFFRIWQISTKTDQLPVEVYPLLYCYAGFSFENNIKRVVLSGRLDETKTHCMCKAKKASMLFKAVLMYHAKSLIFFPGSNGNSSSWSSLGLEGEVCEDPLSLSPSDRLVQFRRQGCLYGCGISLKYTDNEWIMPHTQTKNMCLHVHTHNPHTHSHARTRMQCSP